MHTWVMDFARRHRDKFVSMPKVLEVGSYNVNGTIRDVLPVTIGVDMREGPGVDLVCDATRLVEKFGPGSFDAVVSVEMLEHAPDWKEAVKNMWEVLKEGGIFLLTTRSPGFPLHDYPGDHWRFTVGDFIKMFPDGDVEPDTEAPGVGVCVVKNSICPILNIEPEKPE